MTNLFGWRWASHPNKASCWAQMVKNIYGPLGFPCGQTVKNLPAIQETWAQSLGWGNSQEEEMATHSSILAWGILWTEEPGGLPSIRSHRVGHDWSDLAAAAAFNSIIIICLSNNFIWGWSVLINFTFGKAVYKGLEKQETVFKWCFCQGTHV